jgi:hypothetical protein
VSTNPFDQLTRDLTAFNSFAELIDISDSDSYRPTILPRDEQYIALADAFDAAMVVRGSTRRAWRGQGAAPVHFSLPRRQVETLIDFLDQYRDVIVDGGWDEVEAARETLEVALAGGHA